MEVQIIQTGAEAIILKEGSSVIKKRIAKGYRYSVLDEKIRKNRTKRETRILEKAEKLIFVPKVFGVSKFEIEMEFIDGKKLSEQLDELKSAEQVCVQIGENIAKLHDADVIHGDLTTSNMIFVGGGEKAGRLYFIDFGLSFGNGRIEDKAVDLHLIKQALEAKHFKNFQKFFRAILKGYEISKNLSEVLKRFEKVELRGRYKQQY